MGTSEPHPTERRNTYRFDPLKEYPNAVLADLQEYDTTDETLVPLPLFRFSPSRLSSYRPTINGTEISDRSVKDRMSKDAEAEFDAAGSGEGVMLGASETPAVAPDAPPGAAGVASGGAAGDGDDAGGAVVAVMVESATVVVESRAVVVDGASAGVVGDAASGLGVGCMSGDADAAAESDGVAAGEAESDGEARGVGSAGGAETEAAAYACHRLS